MPDQTYTTMTTYTDDVSRVSSVWSTYGHRFMGTDEPTHESCLTCGAMYQLLADADDPSRGEYMTVGGGPPAECTGDTGMAHGYPGERFCHEHQHDDEPCAHVTHDCPCLFCDS
jgi:hypothetical protein